MVDENKAPQKDVVTPGEIPRQEMTIENIKSVMGVEIEKEVKNQISPIIERFEKEVKTDKTTLIAFLALFSAVIMFLLGDMQILKTILGYWRIVGFSLILLSSLLFFVLVVDYVSKGWIDSGANKPSKQFYILSGVIFVIFMLGMVFSWLGNQDPVRSNTLKIRKIEQQIKMLS